MPKLTPKVTIDDLRAEAAATQPGAELAVAMGYGFESWADLEVEVRRRHLIDERDLAGLEALLIQRPDLATAPLQHWCDHGEATRPLTYVALLRYDTVSGDWRDLPGTGAIATALIIVGAAVDGDEGDAETPLMTAASYGDAEVATALLLAGADPNVIVPGNDGGPALRQAAVCGMTAVVEVLLAAGATDLVHAAGAGDITALLTDDAREADRIAALRFAAAQGQLAVIDELIACGTPVDGLDRDGSSALHEAAAAGRPDSVRHLLALGADPQRRDSRFDATPLEWAVHQHDDTNPEQDLLGVTALLDPTVAATPDDPAASR